MTSKVPRDLEAEKGILGCCVMGAYNDAVADGLTEEWFCDPAGKTAWRFIQEVAKDGEVNEERVLLASSRDPYWKTRKSCLIEYVETAINIENYSYWLEPCRQNMRQRRYHSYAKELLQSASETSDIDALADQAESQLFELRKFAESDKGNNRLESFQRNMDMLEAAHRGQTVTGLPTGFQDFDSLIGGLRNGALYTLAARPGMGKSTLAMNIAEHLAVSKKIPVGFFSLEMSEDELNLRMLGSHSGVNTQRFVNLRDPEEKRLGQIDNMARSAAKLNAAPIYIRPRTDIDINQLRAEARRLVGSHGVKLIIVDYLQLVGVDRRRNGTRAEEVGEISRGLKKMALELDIPVIALAQLNRSIESDNNRMPRLSDLRESGSIEADSDVVAFIYCQNQAATKGGRLLSQIFVGKNRNGPQGRFDICFDRHHSRFEDWRSHRDLVEEAEKSRS